MTAIRQPVAAGTFYPTSGAELAALVDRLLTAAQPRLPSGRLRAVVAPHAGYVYSGTVAASAFAALPAGEEDVSVVLLGPSHFVALRGAAVTGAEAWATPLGMVPVDAHLREAAIGAGAAVDDRPHRDDHALEVELPFLQRRLGPGLRVLPIAVGAGEIPALLAAVAEPALLVVSTDLSHYHDDQTARRLDRQTADALLDLDDAAIGGLAACGAHALRALVRHAHRERWTCTLLDLRTSADASGGRDRVVGYGAFALTSRDHGGSVDEPRSIAAWHRAESGAVRETPRPEPSADLPTGGAGGSPIDV